MGIQMDTVAMALIVGGAALVCSGMIFLLPRRKSIGVDGPLGRGETE